MNRFIKNSIIFLLLVLIALSLYSFNPTNTEAPEELSYSQFVDKVEARLVKSVVIAGDSKVFLVEGE